MPTSGANARRPRAATSTPVRLRKCSACWARRTWRRWPKELRLSQAEVYEVASFYHHFDIVREDAQGRVAPAALTVRVCDGLSCELAGARRPAGAIAGAAGRRRARHRRALCRPLRTGAGGRGAPASGAAGDGRHRWWRRCSRADAPRAGTLHDLAAYTAQAATRCCATASKAGAAPTTVIAGLEASGLRGLGGAGFPAGRKWRIVRAEAAPRLMAVNIDEGEPGTFKDRWYLERDPHRFLEGMLIAAWAVGIERSTSTCATSTTAAARSCRSRVGEAAGRPAGARCRDRSAPRRRRLHLRRRVGDDRIDRRQARHAAPAPALRGAGRPVRPADAGTQLRNPVLGARHRREGRRTGSPRRAPRPQGTALVLGQGRVQEPGVQAGAGGHHAPRAGRRILRRHAAGPRVLRPTCRGAPRAASCRRAWPTCRSTSTRCSRTAASSVRPR
jgi:hypothetical protein